MTITLNGSDLTVTQVVAVARHGEAVVLAPAAIAAMRQARVVVDEVLGTGEPVYGLTTGVGERKAHVLEQAERQRFNQRLVLNHRIAQGDAAPADVVRGAMVCLANSYAKGVTGVRPELCQTPPACTATIGRYHAPMQEQSRVVIGESFVPFVTPA